jgi:hypothetical protein
MANAAHRRHTGPPKVYAMEQELRAIAWLSVCALPLLAALAACERSPEPPTAQAARDVSQPSGWADELAMPVPQDLNPDPNVLEIALEARIEEIEIVPGTKTRAWTYNGSVPAAP